MRRQLLLSMFMTVAVAIPVAADDRSGYPPYRDNRGYGPDGNYGSSGRQSPGGNPAMMAMRDLEMVFRRARVDDHEANHFRRALRELAEFNQGAERGRFDRGSLDRAIDNMADLAKAHQLHPRDRQLIRLRMDDLRYLRSSGARF